MEWTTKQKAKAVARVLERFGQEESEVYADLRAFYAPSECYGDAYVHLHKEQRARLERVMNQVGLSPEKLDEEFDRWIALESPHIDTSWEMPRACQFGFWLVLMHDEEGGLVG